MVTTLLVLPMQRLCSADCKPVGSLSSAKLPPYPIASKTDGTASVLLITSRETRRWVIPKGNRIKGIDSHHAAALEAFEEAGI